MSLKYALSNYNLSSGQFFRSFIVSEYGLRHLKCANQGAKAARLGHRLIAAAELIPLVGFLGSLIERVCVAIDKKLHSPKAAKAPTNPLKITPPSQQQQPTIQKTQGQVQSHLNKPQVNKPQASSQQQISPPVNPASSPVNSAVKTQVSASLSWEEQKLQIKQKMLAAMTAASTKPAIPLKRKIADYCDDPARQGELLDLCRKIGKGDIKEIKKEWKRLRAEGKPSGRILSYNTKSKKCVFELDAFPGAVFKKYNDFFTTRRSEQNEQLRQICRDNGLNALFIPDLEDVPDLYTVGLVVQEKLDFESTTLRQRELFELCCKDPELKPIFAKYLEQLTRFILLTGFEDVKYDNIPLLNNGRGFALIDLDDTDDSVKGLTSGINHREYEGLLKCVFPEMIPIIQKIVESHGLVINFAQIIQECEEMHRNWDEKLKKIAAFHAQQGIKDKGSLLQIDVKSLGLSVDEEPIGRAILERINKKIASQAAKPYTLSQQRLVSLDLNKHFIEKNPDIFKHLGGLDEGGRVVEKVLKALQKQGALYNYSQSKYLFRVQL